VTTVALDLVLDETDDPVAFGEGPLRAAAVAGGPQTVWWVHGTTARHEEAATRAGLTASRRLLQMRCALPLAATTDLATRPFCPGEDDEAWLAVNNRAFSWHPEQGGWDTATLAGRLQESWFDAEGFLLHEEGDRLAGFCWTKVHPATGADPALGEIYVIAVDPDFVGRGLGRDLTIAGLAHLADQGLRIGMLYVESDNTPAVSLYRSLGFTTHQTDTAFTPAP
jgi:mycothiol synthase